MTMGIYLITCVPNGKRYYGSSKDIEDRWKFGHLGFLRIKRHANPIFQNCWNKYGESAFTYEIVEVVADDAHLLAVEQRYLDLNFASKETCMNIARVAGSPMKGRTVSAETRKKIGDAHRGKVLSEETKRKMRKPRPAWFGQKVSAGLRGKKHTVERVANNRVAQPKRVVRGTEIASGRVVEFDSLMSAHREGFNATNVMRCCDGISKTYKGWKWEDAVALSPEEERSKQERRERYLEERNRKARERYANDDVFREKTNARNRENEKRLPDEEMSRARIGTGKQATALRARIADAFLVPIDVVQIVPTKDYNKNQKVECYRWEAFVDFNESKTVLRCRDSVTACAQLGCTFEVGSSGDIEVSAKPKKSVA